MFRVKMVVVTAVTFNLISVITNSVLGTTTTLSEKATNVYDCGLACEFFADCGGFKWDEGNCKLVAPLNSGPSLKTNIYRMARFRGRRIVNGQYDASSLSHEMTRQICENMGMMLLPPPANSREQMILSITRGPYVFIGGQKVSDVFTDELGNVFDTSNGGVNWFNGHPFGGTNMVLMVEGYLWMSGKNFLPYLDVYPICMEHRD